MFWLQEESKRSNAYNWNNFQLLPRTTSYQLQGTRQKSASPTLNTVLSTVVLHLQNYSDSIIYTKQTVFCIFAKREKCLWIVKKCGCKPETLRNKNIKKIKQFKTKLLTIKHPLNNGLVSHCENLTDTNSHKNRIAGLLVQNIG